MLVYYKFYYTDPINRCASNSILINLLLKCNLIATSICKFYNKICSKFNISLKKKKKRNTTQSPLNEWKMLKLIQKLQQKNLETNVTRIWFVSIKRYNKWMFE